MSFLSYFSVVAERHHDQGTIEKKAFKGGLQFQRVSPWPTWRGAWQQTGKDVAAQLNLRIEPQGKERAKRVWCRRLKAQSLPSDTPSARPHLLILSKEFHQLGTKHSNI